MDPDVQLRRYRGDDAEPLLEAARESGGQVFPWLPWCHGGYGRDDSLAWIAHCEATWSEGTEYNFAIVDAADRLLGGCGLNQLRPDHRVANLGYWVRTSAARRGVATAAVHQLAEFAFRETTLARLEIVVALGNVASHRVAAKVGALAEGIARDRLYVHGASHDAVVYALLRSRSADRTPPAPDGTAETILRLEERLLQPDVRTSAAALGALLADDFVEFGSSGPVFDKFQISLALHDEAPVQRTLLDFTATVVSPGIALATYRLLRAPRAGERATGSLRCSIWTLIDGQWRLRFHQGTPIVDGAPDGGGDQ